MIYTDDFFASGSTYQNNNVVQLVDSYTYENVNFKKVTHWINNYPMDDSKVDGIIYRKKGSDYYVDSSILSGAEISAKRFGVKADEITDDSIALQKAVNFGVKTGWNVVLPAGKIKVSQTIVIDFTTNINDANSNGKDRKFELSGKGVHVTYILDEGDDEHTVFDVKGNLDHADGFTAKCFSISRPNVSMPSGGIAIKIEKLICLSIEEIQIFKFNLGFMLIDSCISYFKKLKIHYCKYAFKGDIGSGVDKITNPNLLNFVNCTFNSNNDTSIHLEGVHNVKFDSCDFEGNFSDVLVCSYIGINGKNSLNLINCYFEGTTNGVDLFYLPYTGGTINLIGNSFSRVYQGASHNILVDFRSYNELQQFTNHEHYLNMIGNAFRDDYQFTEWNSYVPVQIWGNNNHLHIKDSNYYDHGVNLSQN
ncbi:glycosyl hydrolase family 28-related protein [Epilithonimonas arachidiradicis]|uniref:Rhamnogalacturonase A/B/Epimerase-like pectate lyase domain-containing protein n=1 Tax=Epilithonimonas arachidiradicis TaxID=1617282 RepID=A0A420DCS6_9FLAO|nr:hypothetical protein [Epilithonimonas arachidiradicis]RKE89695.1 hypothetical protein BXY58_0267 [Epilithonimonas arachidiradicis]GGG44546.1 hypothetical protein GCM10007332_02540 [Epilithonimonas arachidiradicis]